MVEGFLEVNRCAPPNTCFSRERKRKKNFPEDGLNTVCSEIKD